MKEIMEKVIMAGDLARLSPAERVEYYKQVCESLGLNPLTAPFDYIMLSGKLTLYAKKGATDQLRELRHISVEVTERVHMDDVYIVRARATMPDGRFDEDEGAVTVGHLKGDALANAVMKAITKAKRRVTLSIVGLGWLDETELDTIKPAVKHVRVNPETGEIEGEASAPKVESILNETEAPKVESILKRIQDRVSYWEVAKGKLGSPPKEGELARALAAMDDLAGSREGTLKLLYIFFGVSPSEIQGLDYPRVQTVLDWMGIPKAGAKAQRDEAYAEGKEVLEYAKEVVLSPPLDGA